MNIRAITLLIVSLSALFAAGCRSAYVGAQDVQIPKDGAKQCASQCRVMGLHLSAVAIMANHVGCVCQSPDAPQTPQTPQTQSLEAVSPAGMATILMLQQQQQQQQQQSSYRR